MGAFMQQYVARPLPTRHSVMHVLLDMYKEWGGQEPPHIAILDWTDVPTRSEFELFTQYFGSQGYESRIIDPARQSIRTAVSSPATTTLPSSTSASSSPNSSNAAVSIRQLSMLCVMGPSAW